MREARKRIRRFLARDERKTRPSDSDGTGERRRRRRRRVVDRGAITFFSRVHALFGAHLTYGGSLFRSVRRQSRSSAGRFTARARTRKYGLTKRRTMFESTYSRGRTVFQLENRPDGFTSGERYPYRRIRPIATNLRLFPIVEPNRARFYSYERLFVTYSPGRRLPTFSV